MKKLLIIALILALAIPGCAQKSATSSNVIKVVKMSPRDMVEQLKLRKIDAFVAWEPFVSEAVVNGYGKIIATSHDIWPNHPCCVVAARKGVNRSILIAVVWAHVKATRFINNKKNWKLVVQYGANFTGMPKKVIEMALTRIKYVEFPNEKQFKKYYEWLKAEGYLTRTLQQLGYKNETQFFNDFLYKGIYEYVKKKLEENPNWVPKKVNATVRIGYLTADLHQLAFYIALKRGYYKEVGLKVIKKEYPNGVYEMEGFKLGQIDVGYLGSAPATLKRINDNIPIRIIAGVNNEGSAIVSWDANSIKQLAGKVVAIPGFGTVQDFLLRMAAREAGLRVST